MLEISSVIGDQAKAGLHEDAEGSKHRWAGPLHPWRSLLTLRIESGL